MRIISNSGIAAAAGTLALTATADTGDNIAYVSNVELSQAGAEVTITGDPTLQGDAGTIGLGYYLPDGPDGMSMVSLPVSLDAGTYILGGFVAAEAADGLTQAAVVSLDAGSTKTVVGVVQPAGSTPLDGASDVFTISESGNYNLNFSALEYGGDTGETVFVGGDLVLYTPEVEFGSFSDSSSANGTVSLGTIVASQSIATTYNSQGLVDTVTSYNAAAGSGNIVNQVKNTYNGFGQLTGQYQQHAGAVNTSSTLSTTYVYNTTNASENGSRLVSLTYPGGDEIDYNYGSTSSLNSAISRLDSMSEGTVTLESYQYMGLSAVVEKDHPQDGVNLSYLSTTAGDAGDDVAGLDRFGRITDEKWTTGTNGASGTIKDEYTYTYDLDGNVLSKSNPLHTAFNENYTYDGLSRLTAVSRNDSTSQSFALNNIGDINSVTTNGTEQDRTTNDQNQITSIGSANPTYDSNGNITKDDHGDTLVYDAWNRLVAVYNSSGVLLAGYTYDGYGRMTSETNITTTTDFYYSGTQDIEERTGVTTYTGASLSSNGTTTLVNVYSPDYVNDILLRDTYVSGSFNARVYFSHDANFNVTGVISTAGAVLQREVFDPYGNVEFLDGSWGASSNEENVEDLFQGMRYDATIGWYFSHTRWYSPTMQIWSSMDWSGYRDGLDAYEAFTDRPVNHVDPEGSVAFDPNSPDGAADDLALEVAEGKISLQDMLDILGVNITTARAITLVSGCMGGIAGEAAVAGVFALDPRNGRTWCSGVTGSAKCACLRAQNAKLIALAAGAIVVPATIAGRPIDAAAFKAAYIARIGIAAANISAEYAASGCGKCWWKPWTWGHKSL